MASVSFWTLGGKVGFGVAATILGVETAGITVELQEAALSAFMAEENCDPGLCREIDDYTDPTEPHVPPSTRVYDRETLSHLFHGELTDELCEAYRRVIRLQKEIAAHEIAVWRTVCCVYTARVRGDERTMREQERHQRHLVAETARVKSEANEAWEELLGQVERHGLRTPPVPDPGRFVHELERDGFPDYEVAAMHEYGLSADDVENVRRHVLEALHVIRLPRTFRELAETAMWVNRRNLAIETCSCMEPALT